MHKHHICRFCVRKVETPEHVLLQCFASPELLELRSSRYTDLCAEGLVCPVLHTALADSAALALLKRMVYEGVPIFQL